MVWFRMTWHDIDKLQVIDLRGHEDQILQLATSPDGSSVASFSADKMLKLWRRFTLTFTKNKEITDFE